MGFDVMREPWIDCELLRGGTRVFGIRDLLLQAHELKGLQILSPLQEYGVYRLLCVMVMDLYRPKGSDELIDRLGEGSFRAEDINKYLADCEKDGPCFDLFDEKRPFLQSAADAEVDDGDYVRPVALLLHDLPTGNNHVHFDHAFAADRTLRYADCAKALCAVSVFCTSGTQGPSSINGAPPYYVLIKGKNLFETLLLNCVSRDGIASERYCHPGPCYRDPQRCLPKEKVASVSLLEGMTFPARRVRLLDNGDGSVKQIIFREGLDFVGYASWRDPHVILSDKGSSIKPSVGKDAWRNVASVFSGGGEAPLTVTQYGRLGRRDAMLAVVLYGASTKQAAYCTWSKDELLMPAVLVQNADKARELPKYIALADETASYLHKALVFIENTVECKFGSIKEAVLQRYYASVRNKLFIEQIPALAAAKISLFGSLEATWADGVKKEALQAYREGSRRMGDSAATLQAVARAENALYKRLYGTKKEGKA